MGNARGTLIIAVACFMASVALAAPEASAAENNNVGLRRAYTQQIKSKTTPTGKSGYMQ